MMSRTVQHTIIKANPQFELVGLTPQVIADACNYVHSTVAAIDDKLIEVGADRLSQTVELANLSSMIGNLLGAGVARCSNGALRRNGPHTYPDLVAVKDGLQDVEIKMALDDNTPKGHLAKAGYYLTCRYVLLNEDGSHTLTYSEEHPDKPGKRRIVRVGTIPCIWEVRFGWLDESDFNTSNTAGDSGKTAVVNAAGMNKLSVVYCDLDVAPYGHRSKHRKEMQKLFGAVEDQIILDL
ncbi:hypothetical protein [Hymenobacter lapidiphilus]|uniref:hypothetical protein n=1 Tax=Hymenobacter sp. CCM 8763 TaxID=2303334 RepID=UPI0011C17EC8|nr:hypothetical protein [Hymenobacter sp. CCM 8763]